MKGRSSQAGGGAKRSAASAARSAAVCSRQPCCGLSASARKRASRCQAAAAPLPAVMHASSAPSALRPSSTY